MDQLAALIAGFAALAALAAPAHVEPQVSEAPAASRFTFSFRVEHGCGASPTTALEIQTPRGSFDVKAVAKEGWNATVQPSDPPVVVFQGGPLAADTADSFALELVTPNEPGTEVVFPTVQTCAEGELAWIEREEGGDHPAPRVKLTENATPLLPTGATAPSTTMATTGPPTTEGVAVADDEGSRGGGSVVPVAGAALAVVAGVGGAVVWARRRRRQGPPVGG